MAVKVKVIRITPRYLKRAARAKAKRKAESLTMEMAAGLLYVAQGRRRPQGWSLAHNRILHSKNARNGVNGFRYFWLAPGHGWSVCKCGCDRTSAPITAQGQGKNA
jgi:hypothetical protein